MKCRSCTELVTRTFLDLGASPLANSFLSEKSLQKMEPFYPLRVLVCDACQLVQVDEFEAPEKIFNDEYAYFSSYSSSWLEHAKRYAETMSQRFELGPDSKVVEVASNDGYLLQYFKERGIPVLGIEPASNTAKVAVGKGIPTVEKFFGRQLGRELNQQGHAADVIAANNVLAHVPNLHDFLGGFHELLKPEGTITWEFPHLVSLMRDRQFDTIYHEHFSYLSLHALEKALVAHNLTVVDIEQLSTHGGSLRVYARHANAPRLGAAADARVAELRAFERDFGIDRIETYEGFASQVAEVREGFLAFLADARKSGKRVVAYGAPAKGNTFLNFCGVRADSIAYTVDRSPAKQGKFLPGTRVPVLSPEAIFEDRPDLIVILPWNLKEEISRDLAEARSWGAKFVTAIPRLEVF